MTRKLLTWKFLHQSAALLETGTLFHGILLVPSLQNVKKTVLGSLGFLFWSSS